ncbi:MAG: permease prefix domain 1-containing protein [Spirochaetaceae bacterium]|nr:permease prefix domain 1-containing protein [Spirochaetaceae bacterium]
MNTQEYIDKLFLDYEDDKTLSDFKEELESNLKDRISYLQSKGASEEDAWEKATAELTDISEIAQQLSLKKRKEVFEDMYLRTRNYISTKRMVLYLLFGGSLALGIILSVYSFLQSNDILAGLEALIPFVIIPVSGLTFMGLTQETSVRYPLSWKRALFYVISIAVILFGLINFSMMFIISETELSKAIATLIPFVLPGSLLLIFFILTEKEHRKPWVLKQENEWMKKHVELYNNSKIAMKRGLMSGALWLFTIALVVTLGIIFGFKYSLPLFLFAIGGEVLIELFLISKK